MSPRSIFPLLTQKNPPTIIKSFTSTRLKITKEEKYNYLWLHSKEELEHSEEWKYKFLFLSKSTHNAHCKRKWKKSREF